MFTRILIGVDGRSGGRDALALARRLAAPSAHLVAIHVDRDAREGSPIDARPSEALLDAELDRAGTPSAASSASPIRGAPCARRPGAWTPTCWSSAPRTAPGWVASWRARPR